MKERNDQSTYDCSKCLPDEDVVERVSEEERDNCNDDLGQKPSDMLTAGLGPDGEPVEGETPESITLARLELTNGNIFEFVFTFNQLTDLICIKPFESFLILPESLSQKRVHILRDLVGVGASLNQCVVHFAISCQ